MILWLLFVSFLLSSCFGQVSPLPNTIIDRIYDRLTEFHLHNGVCTQMSMCSSMGCHTTCSIAYRHMQAIRTDSYTWADIDYVDSRTSNWTTIRHLERVVNMAQAAACSQCSLNKTSLRFASIEALKWWLVNEPVNRNWWWQVFGGPQHVAAALVLLKPYLAKQEIDKGTTILHRARDKYTNKGQNGLWARYITIVRAVLLGNVHDVQYFFQYSWKQIAYSPMREDGIQPDNIFYQHNLVVQNGAYGAEYMLNVLTLVWLSAGIAEVTINLQAMETFAGYVLDGQQYMMRWNGRGGKEEPLLYWDISVKSREVARAQQQRLQAYPLLKPIQLIYEQPNSYRQNEWKKFHARLQGIGSHLVGTRYFPFGDYFVHHRQKFFISVKLSSNRTRNTECVNLEGVKNMHLSDGVTFIYAKGTEYDDIAPAWDWHTLPGTTLPVNQPAPTQVCALTHFGRSPYAGGCVLQPVNGMKAFALAAMSYHSIDYSQPSDSSYPSPINANKAYFMIDEGLIALGSNISASVGQEVRTTIEQSLLSGAVRIYNLSDIISKPLTIINQSNRIKFKANQSAILHNGMLYVPLASDAVQTCQVTVHTNVTSNWREINLLAPSQPVTKSVFKLQVLHDVQPIGAQYAYAVVPGISKSDAVHIGKVMHRLAIVVKIVSNSEHIQAIEYRSKDHSRFLFAAIYSPPRGHMLQLTLPEASFRKVKWIPLTVKQFSSNMLLILKEDQHGHLDIAVSSADRIDEVVAFAVDRLLTSCLARDQRVFDPQLKVTVADRRWSVISLRVPIHGHHAGEAVQIGCKISM